jgi:hypothetical protein
MHRLSDQDAKQFSPNEFLSGSDNWNPVAEAAGMP